MEKLYWVNNKYACAGFVTKNDYVIITAPILRKHILSKHISIALTILKKLKYEIKEVKMEKKCL